MVPSHVFMGYNSCFQVKNLHGESNNCCSTKAYFKFYVTDDETMRSLETCEVIKCGISLVYVHDDDDCRLLKKKNLVHLSLKTEPRRSCGLGDAMDDVRLKRGRCQLIGGEEVADCKRTKEGKILV